MKKSIVFRWFVLTILLFSVVFLFIGVVQNYFFERYYMNMKIKSLRTHIAEYIDMVSDKGVEATSEALYKNNNIWITKLDEYGRIYNVENYYIEVMLNNESNDNLRIPMYNFEGYFRDSIFLLKVGDEVIIDTIVISGERIPYMIQVDRMGIANLNIANKLHGSNADESYSHIETDIYKGTISKTVFPEHIEYISFPYSERYFLEQIQEFQLSLLANNENALQYAKEFRATESLAEYKIIIEPIIENGVTRYIFAMISLQPVNEAIAVIQQFYPYFFGITFLSIIILAFIFSKWMAKPLIKINNVTNKIANMDFSEKLPVHSEDEIGQLSQNINYLSDKMKSYIDQLKKDLDKERKLETIRKEFISGVSHELKTPLAIMKSCLSILKDGIAAEKREHYFHAMEDEIQRMDLLVVNMLDLAKFKSGTYQPEQAPFEIDKVIIDICKSLNGQIQEKNILLTLNISPQIVIGHKGLISRVMVNFLSNAIRHTKSKHSIIISLVRSKQIIEISVENQGDKILEEDREKIWNQFYRIETHKTKSRTGLGLSISKEILELHNSTYGVENTKDGVRFFFSLSAT